jgi:hypothetical protein
MSYPCAMVLAERFCYIPGVRRTELPPIGVHAQYHKESGMSLRTARWKEEKS